MPLHTIGLIFLGLCHFIFGDYWFKLLNTYYLHQPYKVSLSQMGFIQSLNHRKMLRISLDENKVKNLKWDAFCKEDQFFKIFEFSYEGKNIFWIFPLEIFEDPKNCLKERDYFVNLSDLRLSEQFFYLRKINQDKIFEIEELFEISFKKKIYDLVAVASKSVDLDFLKIKFFIFSIIWFLFFMITLNYVYKKF